MIAFAERKSIIDKGSFVKEIYKPDLDIYSLGEVTQKMEHEKVIREKEEKTRNLDVFHQSQKRNKPKCRRMAQPEVQ